MRIVFDETNLSTREAQIVLAVVTLASVQMRTLLKHHGVEPTDGDKRMALDGIVDLMNRCLPDVRFWVEEAPKEPGSPPHRSSG